jgi:hypothetical protein
LGVKVFIVAVDEPYAIPTHGRPCAGVIRHYVVLRVRYGFFDALDVRFIGVALGIGFEQLYRDVFHHIAPQ